MDTLINKVYKNYDYLSRYSTVPYYFDTLHNREIYGIGTGVQNTTEYITHKISSTDTLDSLALKYYNNPTFWWVIAYFNNIQDPFKPIRNKYTTLKIPNISNIKFGRVNK